MRNIKLTIEYDGTDFKGWQTQSAKDGGARHSPQRPRTVQNEIEKVLKKIYQENIKLTGSGRTDSGVHALGQIANFKTHSSMPCRIIQSALNANLPADVVILKAEDAAPEFHAQYCVKSKTYRYTISNRNARRAFQRDFCLHYPYKLNVQAMRAEAKYLIGRKDFKSFVASDQAKRKNKRREEAIRTIKRLIISKKDDILAIEIEADGFLYKMVRNIVGTLLAVGRGNLGKGDIRRILAQKNRGAAAVTAPARGLALLKVKY